MDRHRPLAAYPPDLDEEASSSPLPGLQLGRSAVPLVQLVEHPLRVTWIRVGRYVALRIREEVMTIRIITASAVALAVSADTALGVLPPPPADQDTNGAVAYLQNYAETQEASLTRQTSTRTGRSTPDPAGRPADGRTSTTARFASTGRTGISS
jgi:hypothetical protein